MMVAVTGATIIDGTGKPPVKHGTVLVTDGRISAASESRQVPVPAAAAVHDARGNYVIPGLIDGVNSPIFNVTLENMVRYEGRYHELFVEAAQVSLKSGVTTMFSTWRGYEAAKKARDLINTGEAPGSRIFIGGNIIGFDGLFSPEAFPGAAEYASKGFIDRINHDFVRGTGRRLLWIGPGDVRSIIREYIQAHDLDYVKYAATGHWTQGGHPISNFITFSPRVQSVIVDEGHRVGLSVQAHTTTIESVDMVINAGVDILTHGDLTGPHPIPRETLERLVEHGVSSGVLPITQRNLEARQQHAPEEIEKGGLTPFLAVAKSNRRNMIQAGVSLFVGAECMIMSREELENEPAYNAVEPSLHSRLGDGYFNALVALEEEGMAPMDVLRAATSNAARAYKLGDIGTIEPGKAADLVVLDANPLESARNYRKISTVVKDGQIVDRDALPVTPLVTAT